MDRLWPRGLKKETLKLDGWLKDVAPSDALRRWFGHDTAKWDEFRRRYAVELDGKPEAWQPILEFARAGLMRLALAAFAAHIRPPAISFPVTGYTEFVLMGITHPFQGPARRNGDTTLSYVAH